MNEHSDFWQRAFGGKDMLKLSLAAYNFTEGGGIYSFCYGDGESIRMERIPVLDPSETCWYKVSKVYGVSTMYTLVLGASRIPGALKTLTGLEVNPFHG